ncbi:hypothetical protein MAR_012122 [Mya arenaria]|uniref:Uncharacterized protein n=1 Tax=Mya arenaria TaxID=6604 RepID=A0ABY7FW20_MYAAR|nr:hypothetical protein MAR_012122 [Mya arenaria]
MYSPFYKACYSPMVPKLYFPVPKLYFPPGQGFQFYNNVAAVLSFSPRVLLYFLIAKACNSPIVSQLYSPQGLGLRLFHGYTAVLWRKLVILQMLTIEPLLTEVSSFLG